MHVFKYMNHTHQHRHGARVQPSACTYVLTIVAYIVKTGVGYLLLATMHYQMVDLLNRLTNQLKPSINFVECIILS